MSVDISVSITEDIVDIIATPTVNIVNVTNSASIDPGLYDLSEFTNTSLNPFVRASNLSSYVPSTRSILTTSPLVGGGDLSANRTISIPQATSSVNGFLSSTDWTTFNNKQNALGFTPVPETRTLTINGLAQDLSTDRSWTISTGLTVGTTPISSGTVGRVLFEGTGNVLQQSSSLFWDETNGRLGIGTETPSQPLTIKFAGQSGWDLVFSGTGSNTHNISGGNTLVIGHNFLNMQNSSTWAYSGTNKYFSVGVNANLGSVFGVKGLGNTSATSAIIIQNSSATELLRIWNDGAVGIGVGGTNAGFRLDVNGTARVSGNLTIATGFQFLFNNTNVGLYRDANTLRLGGFGGIEFLASAAAISSQTIRMKIFDTGNVGINTTTDAGYKLDVNGTARVVNQLTVQGMTIGLGGGAVVSNTVVGNVAFNSNTSGQNNTAIGESALFSNTTGTANVAVGRRALFASNSAQNVALGNDSLRFNTAANNTAVGYFSLYNNTTGASNTSIGHNAGNTTTTGSGNVFIGKDAVALNATDSNQFVVGSSTTNAGSVTSEVNTSTQVWNVVINGVARKILLA
jgi:hypothetical protein